MYGGGGSNARLAFRKRMAEQAAFNARYQAAKNTKASKSIVAQVGNLFTAAPEVEKAVNKTVIAAEKAQKAATQMEQSIPTPAAASALVSETSAAVVQANNAVNKSKKLLNLAKNVNAIANRLRSMTSTSGGKRRTRRRRTHRRRN
jgi:hypothetical protein